MGGRDGYFEPSDSVEGRLTPKGADDSVRTLGVWRAASGRLLHQEGVLGSMVEEVRSRLLPKRSLLKMGELKYIVNCVLIPKLAFPLRDANQWGLGTIPALDVLIRRLYKELASLVGSTSTSQLYARERDGGHGLRSLQDVVDRALVGRAIQVAQRPIRVLGNQERRVGLVGG